MGHNDPILTIHDFRRPLWASSRDLGSPSRPPVPGPEGIINDWWIQLEPVPIPPDPEWFPPHDMPLQDGATTEAEPQSSNASNESREDVCEHGDASGDDFM